MIFLHYCINVKNCECIQINDEINLTIGYVITNKDEKYSYDSNIYNGFFIKIMWSIYELRNFSQENKLYNYYNNKRFNISNTFDIISCFIGEINLHKDNYLKYETRFNNLMNEYIMDKALQ